LLRSICWSSARSNAMNVLPYNYPNGVNEGGFPQLSRRMLQRMYR